MHNNSTINLNAQSSMKCSALHIEIEHPSMEKVKQELLVKPKLNDISELTEKVNWFVFQFKMYTRY